MLGFITYRIPSVAELFGVEESQFDLYNNLHFYLSIRTTDVFGEEQHLQCSSKNKCLVRFMKTYTPVVFYISPPVFYYESYVEVWFDPKGTVNLARDLQSDEMAFVNTEIGGSKLDFEYLVDYETSYSWWVDNRVTGQVGEMPIGHDKDIKMLWEVGYAAVKETEATHCNYDMTKCYKAMNVPVIFNISTHEGYTNGG
jgi:hypothetical protein